MRKNELIYLFKKKKNHFYSPLQDRNDAAGEPPLSFANPDMHHASVHAEPNAPCSL